MLYFTTCLVDTNTGPNIRNKAYLKLHWKCRIKRLEVPKLRTRKERVDQGTWNHSVGREDGNHKSMHMVGIPNNVPIYTVPIFTFNGLIYSRELSGRHLTRHHIHRSCIKGIFPVDRKLVRIHSRQITIFGRDRDLSKV